MIKKLYKAIEDNIVTVNDISENYKVTPKTVKRWLSEESKPKLEIQYSLSNLLDSNQIHTLSQNWKAEEATLRTQIDGMLNGLRESFYRWGKYSSRNEAIEDLCKLLLVQISSIKNNRKGIQEFENFDELGSAFIEYTNQTLFDVLSSYTKKSLNKTDYKLLINSNQNALIGEICLSFKKVDWSKISTIGRLDLFNEIFGKFLANSYVDEKEMGQYLTPIEMTRFMVQLALQKLTKKDIEILCHPTKCKNFGYILDPSCGAGSLLVEIVHNLLPLVIERYGQHDALKWMNNLGEHVLVGIDKSDRMLRLSIYNFCSLGIPCTNLYPFNSLDKSENSDILVKKLNNKVRLILTNPPFGAEFRGNSIVGYKIFNKWASQVPKKIDSELLFIERYVDWLMDGGYCISVVPDSILTNRGLFYDLRNGIHPLIELKAVVSFPTETFGSAGTSTKTSVICFSKDSNKSGPTYFGICRNIGYKVVTKGSNKVKVHIEGSELQNILQEINEKKNTRFGRWVNFDDGFHRWDANFHGSVNESEILDNTISKKEIITVEDVATLINERIDPRRLGQNFQYIEISDIETSGNVSSKSIKCLEAPSRARKLVKHNDVLASTVRPEQKKVGYVNNVSDEGSVCTTGLAVLRPHSINSSLLVELLKTDFVTRQVMRHNIGIAYPAVDESCFLKIVLPINRSDLKVLNSLAIEFENSKIVYFGLEKQFKNKLQNTSNKWLIQHKIETI